jgi:shikimate dehydrogenase
VTRRDLIDEIDNAIAELFVKRMAVVKAVAEEKAKSQTPVADPAREGAIKQRLGKIVGPEVSGYLDRIYDTMFSISREYQEKLINKGGHQFALIGKGLSHSYSALIHSQFGYRYDIVNIDSPADLAKFCKHGDYRGFNVTIPYKKEIIPFLDFVDEDAKKANAVNTVVRGADGKLHGFNTDIFGLEFLISNSGIEIKNKKVLVFGSGGTAETARVVCKAQKAREIVFVTRTGENNFENISKHHADCQVIINTTPVGMFPNNGGRIADLAPFKALSAVVDVIYNPLLTDLLFQARCLGITYAGGLLMLCAQAKRSSDLFLGETAGGDVAAEIEAIYRKLRGLVRNVVLIGISGAGKSTVGREIANATAKVFVDLDAQIEKKEGRTIPEIFGSSGEKKFRELERQAVKEFGSQKGQVIACGGGAILDDDAYRAVKQNGVIILLTRAAAAQERAGRPMLKKPGDFERLLDTRMPIYRSFADYVVENDGPIAGTVEKILEVLDANIGS